MRSRHIWFIAACATGSVIAFLAYLSRTKSAPAMVEADANGDPALEPWCASGLELIDGGGCFAAPTMPSGQVTLIVYLHGRYAPETLSEELDRQARLARLATTKGFAVLALRGTQGECTSPDLKNYWCWPSNERNAGDAPAFISRWDASLNQARSRIGDGSNVLLGFSNGGYFAALIAKQSLARFDAIVIAHGGPIAVEPVRSENVPMLLITADDDASDPEMQRLDDELTRDRWPHALIAREGGHALPDWDIDSALTFYSRLRKERFPFSPPLVSRSPRPRVLQADASSSVDDASVEVTVDGGGDLGDL